MKMPGDSLTLPSSASWFWLQLTLSFSHDEVQRKTDYKPLVSVMLSFQEKDFLRAPKTFFPLCHWPNCFKSRGPKSVRVCYTIQ